MQNLKITSGIKETVESALLKGREWKIAYAIGKNEGSLVGTPETIDDGDGAEIVWSLQIYQSGLSIMTDQVTVDCLAVKAGVDDSYVIIEFLGGSLYLDACAIKGVSVY